MTTASRNGVCLLSKVRKKRGGIMQVLSRFLSVATAFWFIGSTNAYAGQVTYYVDMPAAWFTLGTPLVSDITGTIVTDGGVGPLALSDIVSWNFDYGGAKIIGGTTSQNNSGVAGNSGSGAFLEAAGPNLYVDEPSTFQLNDGFFLGDNNGGQLVIRAVGFGGVNLTLQWYESSGQYHIAQGNLYNVAPLAIASVPEPSDAALLAFGLMLTVGVGRRRQARNRRRIKSCTPTSVASV